MPQYNVFFARFPFLNSENPDASDWLLKTVLECKKDPRINKVLHKKYDDTPIPMTRNLAVKDAREAGADFLCMLDSDMAPDLPIPGAKPFWKTSLDWMLNTNGVRGEDGPCLVMAPYCGPPPVENVYMFLWVNYQSDHKNEMDLKIDMFTREMAATRVGMEEVAAGPTGLILIDMRIFDALKPPWFYYEYTDEFETQKASTEDVSFTRDVSLIDIPCYANWDAWAGHWKRKKVGKPVILTNNCVRERLRTGLLRRHSSQERVMVARDGVVLGGVANGAAG